MNKSIVSIGTIIGAVGLKGYLRINIFLLEINNIKNIESVFLDSNNKSYKIKFIRKHKKNIVISLQNINDRNSAESLIGAKLYIKKKQLPKLKKNEYYLNDLLDFIIVKKNGIKIGIVKDVRNFGAGDLIEVFDNYGKSFFLPINTDNIKKIDRKNKIIVADPIKGIIIEK